MTLIQGRISHVIQTETNMAYLEHPKGTHDRRKSEVSRRQLFAYKKNSI